MEESHTKAAHSFSSLISTRNQSPLVCNSDVVVWLTLIMSANFQIQVRTREQALIRQ